MFTLLSSCPVPPLVYFTPTLLPGSAAGLIYSYPPAWFHRREAFEKELKGGFKNGFSPQKEPWREFASIPRMREKAALLEG